MTQIQPRAQYRAQPVCPCGPSVMSDLMGVRTESRMCAAAELRATVHWDVRASSGPCQIKPWALGFETALPQRGFVGPK